MKQKTKLRLFLGLTLIWSGVIFTFSLQPADASSSLSSGFTKWLLSTFLPDLWEVLAAAPEKMEQFKFFIRKCAHFSEFCLLGILAFSAVRQTKLPKQSLISLGFCALIACTDETIQLFVAGRDGKLPDALLDTAGAATGIVLVLVACKVLAHFKTKRQNK